MLYGGFLQETSITEIHQNASLVHLIYLSTHYSTGSIGQNIRKTTLLEVQI